MNRQVLYYFNPNLCVMWLICMFCIYSIPFEGIHYEWTYSVFISSILKEYIMNRHILYLFNSFGCDKWWIDILHTYPTPIEVIHLDRQVLFIFHPYCSETLWIYMLLPLLRWYLINSQILFHPYWRYVLYSFHPNWTDTW